jgi:hypothetical protein
MASAASSFRCADVSRALACSIRARAAATRACAAAAMALELSASCWDTAPLLKSRSSRTATDCWYPASASAVASSFSVCVIP